jgi:hypothetical protein
MPFIITIDDGGILLTHKKKLLLANLHKLQDTQGESHAAMSLQKTCGLENKRANSPPDHEESSQYQIMTEIYAP